MLNRKMIGEKSKQLIKGQGKRGNKNEQKNKINKKIKIQTCETCKINSYIYSFSNWTEKSRYVIYKQYLYKKCVT